MTLAVVTPPAQELLDASDTVLRQQLELEPDETDRDDLLSAFCAAARQRVEDYTRRRLITQTLRVRRDDFGCPSINLGVAPVGSVSAVRYLDFDGTWQTVSTDRYRLVTSIEPAAVEPEYGQVWPVPRTDRDTVEVEFVAGYGADAAAVPPNLVHAVRLLVAYMFEHREADPSEKDEMPASVRAMLGPWRIWV